MKKAITYVCFLLLIAAMVSCANQRSSKLSLDDVINLSQKGDELSWSDFEQYKSKEIGSGLYILRYEVDDEYYLMIGGGSTKEKPMYIRLVEVDSQDSYIDIRKDDVNQFIKQ